MTIVVVSGALANKPGNGGEAWVRMEWVEGVRRLGFDVYFVEQIARDLLRNGAGTPVSPDSSEHVAFFRGVTRRFGMEGKTALLDQHGGAIDGLEMAELEGIAAEAALLVNVSGHLRVPSLFKRFRKRAYIDLDPGFTQFWHASGMDGPHLCGHNYHFTVGLNVGESGCGIPTDGIQWHPLPPPVVLDAWPVADGDPEALTTVASWRGSFGPIEHEGRSFGLKVHEFRKFIELPERISQRVEVALDIHPADSQDLEALKRHGWRILDPCKVVPDPDAYRRFVQHSGGEFSVAQGIYVETGSGWFSDRTVRYLASGKPVLIQDTGFSRVLPTDEGLLVFQSFEDAVARANDLASDYESHRRAARRMAEEFFDSDRVLSRLLEVVDVAP